MTSREFRLPDLGEGLEDAVLVRWLVQEGAQVTLNQPIAEVETAKATVEIPSPYEGVVARLHLPAGGGIAVGGLLATFDVGTGPEPGPAEPHPGSRPVAATPAVRRIANELGIDLRTLAGSGPRGRVTREDVEEAAARGRGAAAAGSWRGPTREPERPATRAIALDATRAAIADRLTRVAAVPQVTTFRTVDCSQLDALRRELRISPLPIVVRVVAETCSAHPLLNASWGGDSIHVHADVHAGIATDTERGLAVPVLRDARDRGILELAEEISRLAAGARTGALSPSDAAGATITISNTGSYGSEAGTPLLNPGNAVTLAVGAIALRPLVVGTEVVARPACTLSLTFDHRILDGATVGEAFRDLVAFLEDGDRLRALPR
jgi:2-oxoisovalerate dehydrogenase E2 component (dihydrolipoyl transacylase)